MLRLTLFAVLCLSLPALADEPSTDAPEVAPVEPAAVTTRFHSTAAKLEVRLGAGVGKTLTHSTASAEGYLDAVWGITDRFQVSLSNFAVAYRFGEAGSSEWIPHVGFASVSVRDSKFLLERQLEGGVDGRVWLRPQGVAAFGLSVANLANEWNASLYVGGTVQLGDRVVLNLGAAEMRSWHLDGTAPTDAVAIGSVITGGGRQLPLVGVRLTDVFWLELNGRVTFNVGSDAPPTLLATAGVAWVL